MLPCACCRSLLPRMVRAARLIRQRHRLPQRILRLWSVRSVATPSSAVCARRIPAMASRRLGAPARPRRLSTFHLVPTQLPRIQSAECMLHHIGCLAAAGLGDVPCPCHCWRCSFKSHGAMGAVGRSWRSCGRKCRGCGWTPGLWQAQR